MYSASLSARAAATGSARDGLGPVLFLSVLVLGAIGWGGSVRAQSRAYITNADSHSVSVIDTDTNLVIATVAVGANPIGVAVDPSGAAAFVANFDSASVSVVDGATQRVIATIPVGAQPNGIAVSSDGQRVWVANQGEATLSVIDTAVLNVVDTVDLPCTDPIGVGVLPDDSRVYVACAGSPDAVLVLDATTDAVVGNIPMPSGSNPKGVTASADGSTVYAALALAGAVAVIDTTTDQVVRTVPVGSGAQIVAVHPTDDLIYVTSFNAGLLSVIETVDFRTLAAVPVGSPVGVDVASNGTKLFVADAASGSSSVLVIDAATYGTIDTVSVGLRPHAFGKFIATRRGTVNVAIDIRPGADRNVINPRSRGPIAVAVLGSNALDVTAIDVATLRFGPWEATAEHDLSDPATLAGHLSDRNDDGITDLLVHFRIPETGLSCADRLATLIGESLGGEAFAASDSIDPVGCKGKKAARRSSGREFLQRMSHDVVTTKGIESTLPSIVAGW